MNLENKPVRIKMYLSICNTSASLCNMNITVNGGSNTYQYNGYGKEIVLDLIVQPGTSPVELSTDGPRVDSPGDPRILYFRLSNVKIEEVDGS